MASAQVLPASSRKDHLEAGKKKLEEFRKQRKAKAAKKTESSIQNEPTQPEPQIDVSAGTASLPNQSILTSVETTTTESSLIQPSYSNSFNYNSTSQSNPEIERFSNLANGYHYDSSEKSDYDYVPSKEPIFNPSKFDGYMKDPSSSFMKEPEPKVFKSDAIADHSNKLEDSIPDIGYGINTGISREDNVAYSHPVSDWNQPISYSNQSLFSSSTSGTSAIRSRPSFLDTIGVSRGSTFQDASSGQLNKSGSMFSYNNSNLSRPFTQQPPLTNFMEKFNNLDGQDFAAKDISNHSTDSFKTTPARARDEDFAALEQLIEDLTQEKFSLQRALETSKSIAETLTADHASITENYNQQGQVISQLKSDIEMLQHEMEAQSLALDSLRMEYDNARYECNAADERARILASEVISLEEKALKLRSNELRLEKQVESLNSEISSFMRKVSTLERERQDFESTIDALQEERKLLMNKIRNASTNEKVMDTPKAPETANASTSTSDLDESNIAENVAESTAAVHTGQEAGSSQMQPLDTSNLPFVFGEMDGVLPPDQLKMIDNINSLISELSVEREELMRALRIESSNCSKLKELNKDLTHKLETQTQRLELLTAQRMANESSIAKPSDASHLISESAVYADEGDEVVERVLGWIMKLFPGGPAKRRTSKLL
ncbi:Heavy meromyosin-like [Rhynchospora pubera]|uniref:Heavy meromyosin-like n=1 Tax=Rhynchospora pubera TaxID=906938 RepID=A0AAV8G5B2_9POAL|nr:Heavy meromyosin-like [Rhynchospora pubera]